MTNTGSVSGAAAAAEAAYLDKKEIQTQESDKAAQKAVDQRREEYRLVTEKADLEREAQEKIAAEKAKDAQEARDPFKGAVVDELV